MNAVLSSEANAELRVAGQRTTSSEAIDTCSKSHQAQTILSAGGGGKFYTCPAGRETCWAALPRPIDDSPAGNDTSRGPELVLTLYPPQLTFKVARDGHADEADMVEQTVVDPKDSNWHGVPEANESRISMFGLGRHWTSMWAHLLVPV